MYFVNYALFLWTAGDEDVFLAATTATARCAVTGAAAASRLNMARLSHEVKVSPSPHQNFLESSSWNLSECGSELGCEKYTDSQSWAERWTCFAKQTFLAT